MRAEQEVAAHAELHNDLDAELDAVMVELGRVSASVGAGDVATVTAGAVTDEASSSFVPQAGYDDLWDKYDDYGE